MQIKYEFSNWHVNDTQMAWIRSTSIILAAFQIDRRATNFI